MVDPLSFNTKLVLLPVKVDSSIKEADCKKYAFKALCSSSLKIVLALIIKVVTIYVQIFIVEV